MTKFENDEITSTSTSEPPTLLLRIFPNPASDQVYLESNELINNVEVMTIDGNVVISDNIGGKRSCDISIQSLNSGIYLVRITIQNRVHIRKIIKM